jgi:hypothetical protein
MRLTAREVADEAGISKTSCKQISTEDLDLQRVGAQFVPRLLSEEQTQKHLEVSQELLDGQNTSL